MRGQYPNCNRPQLWLTTGKPKPEIERNRKGAHQEPCSKQSNAVAICSVWQGRKAIYRAVADESFTVVRRESKPGLHGIAQLGQVNIMCLQQYTSVEVDVQGPSRDLERCMFRPTTCPTAVAPVVRSSSSSANKTSPGEKPMIILWNLELKLIGDWCKGSAERPGVARYLLAPTKLTVVLKRPNKQNVHDTFSAQATSFQGCSQ